MQRVILRELCFNNKKIVFNEGENYIIGPNGVGKTVLFYLIQYILGIKKSMPHMIKPFSINNLSLKVSFGDRFVYIMREFESDNIVFDGDIKVEIKASSPALGDIYNELLQPNISKEEDKMIGLEILKVAFYGETNSRSLRVSSNLFNKIIGINVELPIQMRKEIDKFKEEIKLEETTNYALESYMSRVENVISKEGINKLNHEEIEYVLNILNKEFKTMRKESIQNSFLLQEARDSLKKANLHNQELFIERTNIINSYFHRLISEFQVVNTVGINDVFNNKGLSILGSEKMILGLGALITLCSISEYDWHNGSGVLVNDARTGMLEHSSMERYRKIISEQCRLGKLQYVEFGYDKNTVPNGAIVLEIDHRGL